MRSTLFILVLLGAALRPVAVGAEAPPDPFIRSSRWVSEADDATALIVNPAGLAVDRGKESYLELNFDRGERRQGLLVVTLPLIRFGYLHDDVAHADFDAYAFGTGIELAPLSVGWTLHIHRTNTGSARSATSHDFGALLRPRRRLSVGFVARNVDNPPFADGRLSRGYAAAVSVRPFGGEPERFTGTLLADWRRAEDKASLGAALSVRIRDGLRLAAHYAARPKRGGIGVSFDLPGASAEVRAVETEGHGVSPRTAYAWHLHSDYYRRNAFPIVRSFADVRVRGAYGDQASGFVLLGRQIASAPRLIQELRKVRDDDDVAGAILTIGKLDGGLIGDVTAVHEEIRQAILDVRAAGKPVVALLEEGGGAAEIYLASAADRIVMPRLATISGIGVSVELLRLKSALADLGIDWDAGTAGRYKSTFHTTYTDSATTAQREELNSLVAEAYRELGDTIAGARGLTEPARSRILSGELLTSSDALSLGLIDRIGWGDDARALADSLAGGSGEPARTKKLDSRRYWRERWTPPPAVAVILAGGDIVSGDSKVDRLFGGRSMGAETVARAIRSAASDPAVKAIVLRVDSGGGSALASDQIRQAILDMRKERVLPFMVSMGGMAASGGYWISMDADQIVADPLSITGSIGVVSTKPVVARLLEKRDVRREVFKAGEHADMFSVTRPMTAEEREQVDRDIQSVYRMFVDGVAAGRHMSPEAVERVAGGRVWFGSQARAAGLVDTLGTLEDAVRLAAARAGVDGDYRTLYFTGLRLSLITRLAQGVEYLKAVAASGEGLSE